MKSFGRKSFVWLVCMALLTGCGNSAESAAGTETFLTESSASETAAVSETETETQTIATETETETAENADYFLIENDDFYMKAPMSWKDRVYVEEGEERGEFGVYQVMEAEGGGHRPIFCIDYEEPAENNKKCFVNPVFYVYLGEITNQEGVTYDLLYYGVTGIGIEPSADDFLDISKDLDMVLASMTMKPGVSFRRLTEDEVARTTVEIILAKEYIQGLPNEVFTISNNYKISFAYLDADGDGHKELLFNCDRGLPLHYIVGMDTEARPGNVLKIENEFAGSCELYNNGLIKSEWNHNQTSMDFWPYTMFQYDADEDLYQVKYHVYAADQTIYSEAYSEEADLDGNGTTCIYYEDDSEESKVSMDDSEVIALENELTGGADLIEIEWLEINDENIRAVFGEQ